MTQVGRFAYAQTRLQAHHARFPSEAEWRRLEAVTNPEHLLNILRSGPMRPWVAGLNPQTDPHRLEQTFRSLLREHVGAVARWQPEEWRDAVLWVRRLPDLPAIAHLLGRGAVPEWIRADPLLRPFALETAALRTRSLADSEYAPLIHDGNTGIESLARNWRRHWRTLWPAVSRGERRALDQLVLRLREQHGLLASGEVRNSRSARQRLMAFLVPAFRRDTFEPAGAFLHLAIVAIQLERLRGILLRLLLFGSRETA